MCLSNASSAVENKLYTSQNRRQLSTFLYSTAHQKMHARLKHNVVACCDPGQLLTSGELVAGALQLLALGPVVLVLAAVGAAHWQPTATALLPEHGQPAAAAQAEHLQAFLHFLTFKYVCESSLAA